MIPATTDPAEPPSSPRRESSWVMPGPEAHGLPRYLAAIRDGKWIILASLIACIAVAALYLAQADKVYDAQADLLVTPQDLSVPVPGIIVQSSDPTRDVETASRLVASPPVARRVKAQLKLPGTTQDVLNKVTVTPVAQSNIVNITAKGSTPRAAVRMADAFGQEFVAERTERLHQTLDEQIRQLEPQVTSASDTSNPDSPANQLQILKTLRQGPDPSVRVESTAELPTSPSAPRPLLTMVAAIFGGAVLGLVGAFGLQVLDPRLRREEQLRRLYGLPILARIPKDARAHGAGALAPESLSPSTIEAYRTLRATLAASRGHEARSASILVTSPSPSEGKTTTAINLASSLALAGNKVILIEADLRRPAIGKALGVEPRHGTGSVLLETVELQDALESTRAYGRYLQLLVADYSGAASGWMADRLFLPSTHRIVAEAKKLADYVIIDSPPLSEVIDALPLAQQADEVLVVVRLGKTQLTKLAHLAELLSRHAIRPVGFAIVGAQAVTEGYYYAPQGGGGSGDRERSSSRERVREPETLPR
jgi:tyrosine-protein kinase